MRNTARQTRENRTITVDFRSEALLPAAWQDVAGKPQMEASLE